VSITIANSVERRPRGERIYRRIDRRPIAMRMVNRRDVPNASR
jgi:hypothetical protein